MTRLLLSIIMIYTLSLCNAQVVDFEQFNLSKGQYLNGSDLKGGFDAQYIYLYNYYNTEFMYWSGWSLSATTDTMTASFTNDLSAASGSGADGSIAYAVSYGVENTLVLKGNARGNKVKSISINNGTYPALSMKNGDAFAKKFGGISGKDKDYFYITIKAWYDGQLSKDSIDFYLADYRFDDNSKDYIVRRWTDIDLSSLGRADSISFVLHSSDVGDFGINTPTYFCIDNVVVTTEVSVEDASSLDINFGPNPAHDYINVETSRSGEVDYVIYTTQGAIVGQGKTVEQSIDVSHLTIGTYILQVSKGNQSIRRTIIKL